MGLDNTAVAPAVQLLSVPAGSGIHYSNIVDATGYGSFSLMCTSLGASGSSWQLQVSNDGTTWITQALETFNNGVSGGSVMSGSYTMGTSTFYTGVVQARYMRLSVGTTTTGTYVVTAQLMPHQVRFTGAQTVQGTLAPGDQSVSAIGVQVNSLGRLYGGGSNSTWHMQRTPTVFKSGAGQSGTLAMWTPTSGYRYRLMRYKLQLDANAAISGGGVTVGMQFADNVTNLWTEYCSVPTTAGTQYGGWSTGWVDLGNGFLSGASDRALNLVISTALTTGSIRFVVCGTEE